MSKGKLTRAQRELHDWQGHSHPLHNDGLRRLRCTKCGAFLSPLKETFQDKYCNSSPRILEAHNG